ncbi:MAG: serine/threonine-protein kinase [bacterium]|nr:serine/threonine-protein kinase [bacterium]
MPSDPVLVEHQILARIAADQDRGRLAQRSEYRAAFPGHERLVDRTLDEILGVGDSDGDDQRPGGERYGPFEVLEVLGRGGQGVVYLAQDTELPRQVALKVLVAGGFDAQRQQRFRREAEVAARLDHPTLCRVLAFGVESNVPYLAMQFVPGDPLSKVIGRHVQDGPVDLSTVTASGARPSDTTSAPDERAMRVVAMVEKLARGLHVAHESGVVHRDLKPGNVMLRPDGEPVLLDFGLARDEGSTLDSLTMTADVLGTPAYMAPEQVAGRRTDRRTDVFALGIVLYECLTGVRPFVGATRERLFDAISHADFKAPAGIAAGVPPDLDLVLAVALEKEPDRRYESAQALADDLARVMRREPVTARPVGSLVRLGRWVQRHRVLASSAALVLAIFVAAASVSTAAWLRSDEARTEAEAINDYILRDLLLAAKPRALGRGARMVDALDYAAQQVDVRFAGQPRLAMIVRSHLAQTFLALGLWQEALDLAQRAVAEGARVQGEGAARVGETEIVLGAALNKLTRYVEAEEVLHGAISTCASHFGEQGEPTLRGRMELAYSQYYQGDQEAAAGAMAALVEESRDALGPTAELTRITMARHFELVFGLGRTEPALELARRMVALSREAFGDNGIETVEAELDLGSALVDAGLYPEAVEIVGRIIGQLEQEFGDRHPYLGTAHSVLVNIYSDTGPSAKAIEHGLRGYEIYRDAVGADHRFTLVLQSNLAIAYRTAGEFGKARQTALAVLEARRRKYGEQHEDVATSYDVLAAIAQMDGDYGQAVEYGRQAVAVGRAVFGAEDPRLGDALWNLARSYARAGRHEESVATWRHQLAATRAASGSDSGWVVRTQRRFAEALHRTQRYREAIAACDDALRILRIERHDGLDACIRGLRAAARYREGIREGIAEDIERAWADLVKLDRVGLLDRTAVLQVLLEIRQAEGDVAGVAAVRERMKLLR